MPVIDFSNAQQPTQQGWSLNPLTDLAKASSGIGDWINQHTGIGGFNPGIGSAVSTIGGIIPGLANLGIAAVTPWSATSRGRLQAAGEAALHGVEDTATDVATVGGLAPYTNMLEGAVSALPGSYTPSTLRQYATEKGGPGLLGAGLNDLANLAMGAGAVGKLAEAGELGEAARGAMAADKVAQLSTAAGGGLPGDVAAAGSQARLAAASDAARSSAFAPEDVLQRAKLLDRLDVVRQGADYAFNPLRAWQALGAPLGRAAVLDAVPEAGLTTEAGRLAQSAGETAQEATQGVSEHVPAEAHVAAPQTGPAPGSGDTAIQQALADLIAHTNTETATSQAEIEAGPHQTLYRGERPVEGGISRVTDPGTGPWYTDKEQFARDYAGPEGNVYKVHVPQEVADAALSHAGSGGLEGNAYDLGKHPMGAALDETAKAMGPLQVQPGTVLTREAVGEPPPPFEPPTNVRARDLGPKEAQVNLARAKEIPDWATKIVSHLPEPAKRVLRAMEYRSQAHQLAGVIQESERTVRMKQAAELREPYAKAHIAAVQELSRAATEAGHEIDLEHADRIVGERVHAAMTAGPVWHEMELLRPQLEAIEPGAVEKAFGFHGKLPPELNTDAFRAQVQNIADLAAAHIEGRGEFAATSPYLGARGMQGLDETGATMTKTQERMLRAAVEARLQAHNLQPQIESEVAGAHAGIEAGQAAAEQASQDMGAARGAKGAALQSIIENRYGPRIAEDENGVVQPGEPANPNLTEKQMVSSGTGREGETPQETYRRALKAQQALEDYQAATEKERQSYATMLQAHQSVADLQEQLSNATLPSQMAAGALHGRSDALLAKLQDQMDNAPVNRVPPVYQPITRAALEIARLSKDYPELADVLAEVPQKFSDAVRHLADQGFDPVHISEMTEEKARRLVMGSSILSPDLGKQEIGLFRKGRTGALANAGLDSRTLAGMAAQMASVWHEDRVNAIADTVDRLYAVPAPLNADGLRFNPNPAELTWWDAQRRGLLSTTKPETGEQTAVQGRYLIPKSVARTIDAYSKDHSNMLQRALAKTTDPWRALVLTASPKFYVNHMVGHIMLGAIQGVSLKQWAAAWDEAKNGFQNYPELTKQGIYEREAGMPASLVPYGSIGEARASEGMMGGVRAVQQRLNNAVNTVDAFAKAALAIRGEAKGLTREESLHFAQQAGVDYAALSPFERQVVRSVIPFYSFEKGVLKIVMQYPLDHPVAANLLMQTGRLQQHWAVDANGNPLPTNYQAVVDIPGIGKVNLRNLTPFKDTGSLVTASGLTNSLQFIVQAAIRSGLGVAAPGVKAGVKTGPTGSPVPDVPFGASLANAFASTPQGTLLSGGSPLNFLGIPTVSQSTLDNAGQRNVLTQAETQLPLSTQQKATAFPVDTNTLQNALAQIQSGENPLTPPGQGATPPVTPGQTAATTSTASTPQITAALQAAQTKQQAAAAASKAKKGTTSRGGGGKVRVSNGRKASNRVRSGGSGHGLHVSTVPRHAKAAAKPARVSAGKSPKLRFQLRQGFGKAQNARRSSGGGGAPIFKSATKGVAGMHHRGRHH